MQILSTYLFIYWKNLFKTKKVDQGTLEFEKTLVEDLLRFATQHNGEDTDIKTYINIARSFNDLSNDAISTDVPRLVAGISIVYVYALVMLGGFGCVPQKVNYYFHTMYLILKC